MSKKILIVLDAGHGTNVNKGVTPGYYEGNKMYDLTEFQKSALESYGFKVMLTRNRNSYPDLDPRGQMAVKNGKGYDHVVFISNHTNAGNSGVRGTEIFRSLYLPDSNDLAVKLCKAIVDTIDTNNRGVKTRQGNHGDYYGVIRSAVNYAKSVKIAESGVVDFAFLIEYGFHTNAVECAFLNDDTNLKALANVTAKTLADYFGMKKTSTKKETTKTTSSEVYRVRKTWKDSESQIGAYKSLANAKKLADKNPGYSVFNSKGKSVYTPKLAYKGTFPSLTSKGYIGDGDKGTNVKNLQKYLNWYGGYNLTVDGIAGDNTVNAIKKFQKAEGLTVDGKFGVKSLTKAKAVKR